MDRELLRAQCEAYALGALEGEERKQLEALLKAHDAAAEEELSEAVELVAQVAHMAPLADPPALLRSRVLNGIRGEVGPVRPRRSLAAFAGWAVAAGLAVFGILAHFEVRRSGEQLAQARADVEALRRESARNARIIGILRARDARMIRLATAAPEAPQFRAYWSPGAGLVLAGMNIPAPASGRTMQLWLVPKKGNPISAGVFEPDERGEVLHIADAAAAAADTAALAISDEPDGGSAQPTTKPNWIGAIGE